MTKTSKIKSVEILVCDAGWRNYHFLKIIYRGRRRRLERVSTRASAHPASAVINRIRPRLSARA